LKTILGIDPGVTGGFAIMRDGEMLKMWPMPMLVLKQKKSRKIKKNEDNPNGKKTKTYIANVRQLDFVHLGNIFDKIKKIGVDKAYLENVHARPDEGVSSSFKFGIAFGSLLSLLAYKNIPYTLVSPVTWTKKVCIGAPAAMDTKDRSRLVASRLFPSVEFILSGCKKAHMGLVDSALIAYYGYIEEK